MAKVVHYGRNMILLAPWEIVSTAWAPVYSAPDVKDHTAKHELHNTGQLNLCSLNSDC